MKDYHINLFYNDCELDLGECLVREGGALPADGQFVAPRTRHRDRARL